MPNYSQNSQIDNFYKEYLSSGYTNEPLIPVLVAESYLVLANRNYFASRDESLEKIAKDLEKYSSARIISFVKGSLNKLDDEAIRELVEFTIVEANSRFCVDRPNAGSKVTKLIYHMLKLRDGDSIYDLGCGNGVTLANLYLLAKNEGIHLDKVAGIDISDMDANICRLTCIILCGNDAEVDVETGDALQLEPQHYTKGYVYPPINQRSIFRTKNYKSILNPEIEFIASLDEQWIYVDRLLSGLNGDNPKAVALLFGKSFIRSNQNAYLQSLIRDGWIESIITLPEGMIPGTCVISYIVVFSPRNSQVMFLDASGDKYYTKTRGYNLGYGGRSYDVNAIINAYDAALVGNCEDSTFVENTELKDVINLTPKCVSDTMNASLNGQGIPLGSVARIITGCQYTASAFDVTRENTGYKILTSSDIVDGTIEWDNLRSVVNNKTLRDDIYLRKNDVIVTTKSTIVKVAVVDIEPEDKVIATGGMIIVRPQTDKLNPTYLKMYLDSPSGVSALKSIQVGSVITHISSRSFETIEIPDVDINVQNEKAKQYNEKLVLLISHRNSIKKLEEELNSIIDDEEI